MTIQPNHPTDYRMVKLIDGTLLVGTISVDEQFLRIENPLMLTTVQRMTEYGLKDDSSLSPWIPFTSDEKFNISKDKIMVISMAAQELASYYEVVLNKYKSKENFTLKHFQERINIYTEEEFDYEIHNIDLKE